MMTTTISEAQKNLPHLIIHARTQLIWLTDEDGNVVGALAGVGEDGLDDILTRTPAFQALIEGSRASLQTEAAISVHDLLAEAKAELASQP
ncbi:MAG: hypothetical protein ACREEM_17130 [Blastocatellia bacterium]